MTERQKLLSEINTVLSQRNLKPLHKLGDASEGEIEVISLLDVYDHSARFFTDVRFGVKFPNGSEGAFTVRFNANGAVSDGAVSDVLINGKFAIVKQWRLPLGQWTYEVPRGFGEKLDNARINGKLGTIKIADLPLATLARELSEEVMASARIAPVTHLGNVAENSGTSAVVPSYFMVQLFIDEDKLTQKLKGSEHHMSVKLWDKATVRQELGNRLCDNHSITALALALNYLDNLPH
jgi:hypothetical protein